MAMAREARLDELLRSWQDLRRLGHNVPAEELCQDCPELVEELKRCIEEELISLDPSAEPHVTSLVPPILLANRDSPVTPLDISGNTDEENAHRRSDKKPLALLPDTEPVPGYRLVELLGRGGFGEAWRALGPGGFPVALKFLRIGEGISAPEVRSLTFLKDIRHANLLSVFGAWQNADYIIIAMELADRTLLDRSRQLTLQGQIGIPFQELIDYMYDAAKGIDYLNEPCHVLDNKVGVSIQHRDIKPHNLFLVGGSVKVGDFGLARVLEQNWTHHSGSMTPAYAAPEFFRGQTSDRSDQYSLAVTYCHLRGGRLPFSGNIAQITAGHLLHPPNLKMLPMSERPVVSKALSKKPQDRWPNCRGFVRALAAAQGELTPNRPDLTPPPPGPPVVPGSVRPPSSGSHAAVSLPEAATAKSNKSQRPESPGSPGRPASEPLLKMPAAAQPRPASEPALKMSPVQAPPPEKLAISPPPTPVPPNLESAKPRSQPVVSVPGTPGGPASKPRSQPVISPENPSPSGLPAPAPWEAPAASAAAVPSPARGLRLVRPSPSERARDLQERKERLRTQFRIIFFVCLAAALVGIGFWVWDLVMTVWHPGR